MNINVFLVINFILVINAQEYDIKMMTWNVEGNFFKNKNPTM